MKLPAPADNLLRQAFRIIEQSDSLNVKRGQAQDSMLLKAPDGKVWRVTVNNLGQIVTQAI